MNYDNINDLNNNSGSGNNTNGMFNLIYNNIHKIYDVLIKVLQSNPSFDIASEEPAAHIVHVMVGKSLFSSGEEITISLEEMDENKTKMYCSQEQKEGAADSFRAKYGTLIQKLLDKINQILPPVVEQKEEPKPDNHVTVGELTRQMNMQPGQKDEPTSLTQFMNSDSATNNNANGNTPTPVETSTPSSGDDYKNQPKPFDYASLKENESSKHAGNDPLLDLMKNI